MYLVTLGCITVMSVMCCREIPLTFLFSSSYIDWCVYIYPWRFASIYFHPRKIKPHYTKQASVTSEPVSIETRSDVCLRAASHARPDLICQPFTTNCLLHRTACTSPQHIHTPDGWLWCRFLFFPSSFNSSSFPAWRLHFMHPLGHVPRG